MKVEYSGRFNPRVPAKEGNVAGGNSLCCWFLILTGSVGGCCWVGVGLLVTVNPDVLFIRPIICAKWNQRNRIQDWRAMRPGVLSIQFNITSTRLSTSGFKFWRDAHRK